MKKIFNAIKIYGVLGCITRFFQKLFYSIYSFFKKIDDYVYLKHDENLRKKRIKKTNQKYGKIIPILVYHDVSNIAVGDRYYFVKIKEFQDQMNYLKENNYKTLFLSQLSSAYKYENPIIITFDDGYKGVYENAFPILKSLGLKATVFMISDNINEKEYYMNQKSMLEMSKSNLIEIGSHSVTHPDLTSLSQKELDNELSTSKSNLEKIIGKKVNCFSYPMGKYNDTVITATKKYYEYAVTTDEGPEYSKKINPVKLKRIKIYRKLFLINFVDKICR